LARLALFCVEHAGLGRYSAATGLTTNSTAGTVQQVEITDSNPTRRLALSAL